MDFRVIYSRRAVRDLTAIIKHIASANPDAAFALAERLEMLAESLGRFPLRYPKALDRPGLHKFSHQAYTIYYAVDETARLVTIRRFWHSARQPPFI